MSTAILSKEDYILHILNHLEPEKSDKYYLNKLAFLAEFSYLHSTKSDQPLSTAEYAAITHGPAINDYDETLMHMQKKGLIKVEGKNIRVLSTKQIDMPDVIKAHISDTIRKYSPLSFTALRAITHNTDSYKITTKNEKVMGRIIDKDLAALETFFDDGVLMDEVAEADLPLINRDNLVPYEFGPNIHRPAR